MRKRYNLIHPRINPAISTDRHILDGYSRDLPIYQVWRELTQLGRKVSYRYVRNQYHYHDLNRTLDKYWGTQFAHDHIIDELFFDRHEFNSHA